MGLMRSPTAFMVVGLFFIRLGTLYQMNEVFLDQLRHTLAQHVHICQIDDTRDSYRSGNYLYTVDIEQNMAAFSGFRGWDLRASESTLQAYAPKGKRVWVMY